MPRQDFVGHRELPEPPEDSSRVALDAYALECRALGASPAQTAQELGVSAGAVRARLRRLDTRGPDRARRWLSNGESLGSGT
jgi:predicted ArsR family transcriptional regulator